MVAFNAQGTTVSRETNVAGTYAAIGEIRSFSGPGGQAAVIDATTLASLGKEKLMGLQDEGQLTLECNFDPNNNTHKQLLDDRKNRTKKKFQIAFSSNPAVTVTFDAFVLGASVAGGVDALTTITFTLEITGAIDWPAPT